MERPLKESEKSDYKLGAGFHDALAGLVLRTAKNSCDHNSTTERTRADISPGDTSVKIWKELFNISRDQENANQG